MEAICFTFYYTVGFLNGYWTGNRIYSLLTEEFKFTASHTSFIQWRCSNNGQYLNTNEEIEDHFPLNSSEVPTVRHCTVVARVYTSHTPNLNIITTRFCHKLDYSILGRFSHQITEAWLVQLHLVQCTHTTTKICIFYISCIHIQSESCVDLLL